VGRRIFIILFAITFAARADAAEESSRKGALTLASATAEALANNPGIQSALRKWNAARARIPQAKSWDDPRMSYDNVAGRFVAVPANAFTDQSLTLEQILPVSGKNLSRSRIAAAEALVIYEEMRRAQLDVVSRLRAAWFQLANANRQMELNRENAASLSQISETAQSKYQSGTETAPGVLQAKIESSKLEDEQLNIERARSEAQTQINVLMNRPVSTSVATVSPPPVPSFDVPEASLIQRIFASRPEVRAAQDRLEAERARVQLAKREWIPDPAVNVNAQRYNGADQAVSQVGAGISFSIPWVNPRKYSEGVKEAQENTEAVAADLQRVEQEALGMLRDQLKRIETAHHHYDLFSGKILTQARQAFDTAQLGYSAGKISFADWITAQRTRRDVETTAAQMLADYQTAIAELEAIVGSELAAPIISKPKPHHQ
jgi:outer membrane protein TolC